MPRSATGGPTLYLAGNGELWVVDVSGQRVRHLHRSLLDVGDAPHRILARGRRLVMGSQFGGSAFFLPSLRRDRVWLVDISPRAGDVRAVREVTVDGVTTVPATVPPRRRTPIAAVDGGLLLNADDGGVDVWDPLTGRVVRHLSIDANALGPATARLVTSCTDPQCHAIALTDPRSGATRRVRAPGAYTFEPWTAAFSPRGDILAIPIRVVADGPRQLALVDLAHGRVAIVPSSSVSPGYTLVAWSASGRDVFLTGGGAYATPRVLVGYRFGAPGAQRIHVPVGDFYDLAAI
jgi:WD40 repeat protein